MRVAIIGAGAGGLFFAVMMKRADRSHAITVFERNAPDATFGFGVVFPARTLRYLQEADDETYEAVTSTTVGWDAIEYRLRGRVVRCGGHGFSGIARVELLKTLQERARSLGVDLRFEHVAADVSSLADYDLIVAADGINSVVRREFANQFRPSIHVGRAKYIWLGTTKRFDALTFIVEEDEHGCFGVHAYPYNDTTSTFIVETDEGSWHTAGLDRQTDSALPSGENDLASVAYCETLFAKHLDGHRLLVNNSKWLNFRTVRNRVWHWRNIVLLGDAAHTAHFSIGSGTRMAMEDAIALSRALERHGNLAAALEEYEGQRRPAVERIQRAGEPSRKWWEHLRHWAHLDPEQFAFHHLTRTRLVTYDNLRIRDPGFVKSVESWFATGVASGHRAAVDAPAPMSAPLKLRNVMLPNRVGVSPADQHLTEDGVPTTWHLVHLGGSAVAGAGLVMTGMTAVSLDGRSNPSYTGMWSDSHAQAWERIIDFVHTHTPARVGVQLGYFLRSGGTGPMREPVGGPEVGMTLRRPLLPEPAIDRLLSESSRLLEDYVKAAQLGDEAGFDLLELHCAIGSLPGSFLAGAVATRADQAHATAKNPMAFASELFDAVRAAWPQDKPICVHLSVLRGIDGERGIEGALELAQILKARGCDVLALSVPAELAEQDLERARVDQMLLSDLIRNLVGMPTMIVGENLSAEEVNTLILAGRADLCRGGSVPANASTEFTALPSPSTRPVPPTAIR